LLENKMLRIKSLNTPRISNSLAVFAALLLMVSAMAGFGNTSLSLKDSADQSAGVEPTPAQLASESPAGDTHKNNKSFKVSLFLFRID